jgi:hypothetical protein
MGVSFIPSTSIPENLVNGPAYGFRDDGPASWQSETKPPDTSVPTSPPHRPDVRRDRRSVPGQRALSRRLQSFVEELALCVEVNGAKGPALLWPEDPTTLPALLELPRPGRPEPMAGASMPGGPDTEALAAELGHRLRLRVSPFYRFLPAGSPVMKSAPSGSGSTVTVLEGACRCALSRMGEDPAPRPSHPLGMRLRSGGTLFATWDHTYLLSEIHAPTTLLELRLEDPD